MTVFVVFSSERQECEVFKNYEDAVEFGKKNSYIRWFIAQREIK